MTAVRSTIYVVCFYLWTAFVSLICTPLLFAPLPGVLWMFRWWGAGVIGLLRICDVRVEVRGREHIPTGAALVAPKHQCMLDVFAQFNLLPSSAFVMKKSLAYIPWFGWYGVKAGAIVIDREGHAKTLRQVVREGKALFAANRQIVIFPEGTRTAPGATPDYKPGIAALYRELDVPVHPVATNAGLYWSPKGFKIRGPGVIVFEYLEPIPPGLKRGEFMRILEERIETATARLLAL